MTQKSMKRIHAVTLKRIPDTSYLEQDEFSDRLRQFNDGLFCYIGIIAEAEVNVQVNDGQAYINRQIAPQYLRQTITSGGLWGIESDSDASYLEEIEQEQLSELRGQLHAIGFSQRAITAAFRNIVRQ